MSRLPAMVAAVILAAGKGSRMESDVHKVLHPLAGKALLAHVLDNLKALGAEREVVVLGAGREQITSAFPRLTTAVQEEQLGTAHAVQVAAPALEDFDGIVLVLYGDVPLVSAETMARLCMAVDDVTPLAVLGFRPEDTRSYGRLVTDTSGGLERIVEHADATPAERAIGLCNSGIVAARAERLFSLLSRVGCDNAKGEYYLTDIVGLARQEGYRVATVETDSQEVTGVNSKQELAELESLILNPTR
ncbi:NTP transferase domain-containing protein [Halomonas sp. ML-15]|uniref:sugar phosphate nucleotidyltransferase n=1 Tax=Halomonas sp. ML-15 TaxID=2773305 RepID=UPI001746C301|nr:NTP transferase domain-containing protein [Halomonas sp. ML-15]MBD3894558.1 NTP transferase domain-containing protein [Halomonas sp. ML-15]